MRLLLVPLLLSVAAGPLAAQVPATAVDSMLARVGTTVDASEKDYFGLFPEVALSSFVDATFEPLPSGEMQVVVRTPRRTDERRLDAETVAYLARYVTHYEALNAPNLPSHLSTVGRRVELSGLARHQLGDQTPSTFSLDRSDGTTVQGWLLLADDEYLLLHDADAPFDLARLDERVTAVPTSELRRITTVVKGQRGAFVEAGVGLALQAVASSLSYSRRRDLSDPISAGYALGSASLGSGMFWILRNARGTRLAQNPVPLLDARIPSAVQAWRDGLPDAALRSQATALTPAPRSRVNLMISVPWQAEADGVVRLNAKAIATNREFNIEAESAPEQVTGRISIDATVALSRRIHAGAQVTVHHQPEPLGVPMSSTSIGRTVIVDQLVERISRNPDGAIFGGITLGGNRVGTLSGRVEIGGGVAYQSASVEGAFRATAAQPRPSPFRGNTVRGYTFSDDALVPFGRIAYDWYVTPVTSFSIIATWAMAHDLVVPEQQIAVEIIDSRWEAVQPEHRITLSTWGLSFGLRTHL